MSQNVVDFSDDPSGVQLLDNKLTPMKQNILTQNSGTSRPSYATEGTEWLDKTTTPWVKKFFDGTDDIVLGTVNATTNVFTPAGLRLDKLDATSAPTVNDDSADGYSVGSVWVNVTADDVYFAVDVTVGAAVWRKMRYDTTAYLPLTGGTLTGDLIVPSVNGGGQLAGFRNAIINGAMDIWQRGTSFAAAADNQFSADRWFYSKSGAMVHTLSRSTDVPTVAQAGRLFNYSLLVDCTTVDSSIAAGDYAMVGQRIEGFNWAAFAQRALTLSFWVKATKTGTYCVSVINSGSDRSYVGTYTVNAADTWEYKTVSVTASPSAGTWNYDTGVGARIHFALASGSTYQTTAGAWQTGNFIATSGQVNACDSTSNDFRIVGVQLETGSQATPFENRGIAQELAMCQRYYEKSYPYVTAPGTSETSFYQNLGFALNNTFFYDSGKIFYRVSKRLTNPTVTLYSTDGTADRIRDLNASSNISGMGIGQPSEIGFVAAHGSGGLTTNNLYACHWTSSSEL